MFQAIFNCNLTNKGINKMEQKKFVKNNNFLNFLYHAVASKLDESILESECCNDIDVFELTASVWGDFFEQVLGVDRQDVLKVAYKKLSAILKEGLDISDPEFANFLYQLELSNVCGSDNLELDEIYELKKVY